MAYAVERVKSVRAHTEREKEIKREREIAHQMKWKLYARH